MNSCLFTSSHDRFSACSLVPSGPESTAAEGPAHAHPAARGAPEEGEGEQEEEEAAAEPQERPEAESQRPPPPPPPPPPAVPPPVSVPPSSPGAQLPATQGAAPPDRTGLPPQVQPQEALRRRRTVAGETSQPPHTDKLSRETTSQKHQVHFSIIIWREELKKNNPIYKTCSAHTVLLCVLESSIFWVINSLQILLSIYFCCSFSQLFFVLFLISTLLLLGTFKSF